MGARDRLTRTTRARASAALAALVGACCPPGVDGPARVQPVTVITPAPPPAEPGRPRTMADQVVEDFERAVQSGRDAYLALFDFQAVGAFEILLHRYDLLGRLSGLPDDLRGQFAAEDGTPYPAERERTNVGGFYELLAVRTVGSGGCAAVAPRTRYARELARFDPLPPGTPEAYEQLRATTSAMVAAGGVTGLRCRGGRGGIALVWTARPGDRGYDLITIYDD